MIFKKISKAIAGIGLAWAALGLPATNLMAQVGVAIPWNAHYETILEADLDKRMAHKGEFMGGVRFKDEGGEQTVFFCYDSKSGANDMQQDLYAYQYSKVGGNCSMTWDIKDFSGQLCGVNVVPNSLQIIDLDQDGYMEVCFMYQNQCDGLDPIVTKMMLLTKGKKLAIRGKFSVEEGAELEKNVDPVVGQYPPLFKNFMLMNWNEFKAAEFEYSKNIEYKTDGFIVLEKEYQMASGGTEYELLDLNGLPMALGTGMKEKINYAGSLELMPDRKTLLYAGLKGIGTYDPATKKETSYMTFLESTEAISSIVWSPDKKKVAFTALNPAEYPQKTKIFVLSLEGNQMVKKDKFDAALMYMAAADWVVESPRFKDNNTIEYTEMKVVDDMPDEGPVKTISLK